MTKEEMEGPILFWGYKEQESNLILPEQHDDDDDDDDLAHFFLEWEMFQTEVVEKIKTHILCSVTFFLFENRAFYEIKWKNTVESGRPQMTIWRTRIECWIPKATNTHS